MTGPDRQFERAGPVPDVEQVRRRGAVIRGGRQGVVGTCRADLSSGCVEVRARAVETLVCRRKASVTQSYPGVGPERGAYSRVTDDLVALWSIYL